MSKITDVSIVSIQSYKPLKKTAIPSCFNDTNDRPQGPSNRPNVLLNPRFAF